MAGDERWRNYPNPITLRMTNSERAQLEKQAADRRFGTTSAYLRFLVKQDQESAAAFAGKRRD